MRTHFQNVLSQRREPSMQILGVAAGLNYVRFFVLCAFRAAFLFPAHVYAFVRATKREEEHRNRTKLRSDRISRETVASKILSLGRPPPNVHMFNKPRLRGLVLHLMERMCCNRGRRRTHWRRLCCWKDGGRCNC